MSDARDIVTGKDAGPAPHALETILQNKATARPAAEAAERRRLPTGMHRELYNLVGGRIPIAPSSGYTRDKAGLGAKKPVKKWKWAKFTNPARKDKLKLSHWIKEEEEAQAYAFAKFNKTVSVPTFTEVEHQKYLNGSDWTYSDTKMLFDLCSDFDLRFVVIHDRFTKSMKKATGQNVKRSIEDLKERFYDVRKKLARARNQTNTSEYEYKYDAKHERLRKEQLRRLLERTPQQVREESLLAGDLKKIELRKREAAKTQSTKATSRKRKKSNASSSAAAVAEVAPVGKGVVLRSSLLQRPLPVKPKMGQQVVKLCDQLGISRNPLPTEKITALYTDIRESLVSLVNLRQMMEAKQAEYAQLQTKKQVLAKAN